MPKRQKNTPAGSFEGEVPLPESVVAETVDPIPEEDEGSPEPIARTGYTPQQRPHDYKSRPSSRDGNVDEPDAAESQDAPSRPPTRNGRASSRSPSSRSASKSRASSRSSRSRSRPRSSGGSKSPIFSSSTMATVEEAETMVEQFPEETTTATHGSLDSHHDEKAPTNLPEGPVETVPESEAEVKDVEDSFLGKLGRKLGSQKIFGPMTKESEAPAATTPVEEVLSETYVPAVESTDVEQGVEDALSVGSASPLPSPAFTPSEPSSDYQYEDAEEDYDYDDQYQYQYDPDQYDDYTYDSQEEYHDIPEGLLDEDYTFEDEDGDESAYGETEEFDYEKFKGSL